MLRWYDFKNAEGILPTSSVQCHNHSQLVSTEYLKKSRNMLMITNIFPGYLTLKGSINKKCLLNSSFVISNLKLLLSVGKKKKVVSQYIILD